jgi:ribose 5-phosphate isomerase A
MAGDADSLKEIARRALDYVGEGEVIGLGTGRASVAFVRALGERVQKGLRVTGVPTSESTAELARGLGIALARLEDVDEIATTFDGADEVDPSLDLIKGYGGALVREKIVAASSRRRIMLVGEEKMVDRLGAHGKLPVEVVPFGLSLCRKRLASLGLVPRLREVEGRPFVTDNGNLILDCGTGPIADPAGLEREALAIPGVVGTGLFLAMADVVLIQKGSEVLVRERRGR